VETVLSVEAAKPSKASAYCRASLIRGAAERYDRERQSRRMVTRPVCALVFCAGKFPDRQILAKLIYGLLIESLNAVSILIGTSGWSYRSWRGPFFPQNLPAKHRLSFYATQFPTTELNGVFYRTPTIDAVRKWRKATPDDFVFAWKASRFITHWKRLSENSRNSLSLMETRLRLLGDKVGPILFQMPPQFSANRDTLAHFVKMLKTNRRYAFEFRDPSWFEPAIMDLLRDNDISLCISDHRDAPAPWKITASFVYIRAHGPGGAYAGRYSRKRLSEWGARIKKWNCDVYVYFDNDQKSAAPKDAQCLKEIVGQSPVRSSPVVKKRSR